MLKAFFRLILIGCSSFVVLFFIVISLRQLGAQHEHIPHDHPFLSIEKWSITRPDERPSIAPSSSTTETLFFRALDLYQTRDGHWVSHPKGYVTHEVNGKKIERWPLGALTLAEAQKYFDENLIGELTPILLKNKKENFLLNILQGRDAQLKKLVDDVSAAKAEDRVAITSPFQSVLVKVRELKPLWIYGMSQSEISRLRFFTSLWLEPLVSTKADFVNINFKAHPRLIAELQKRKIKIIQ